MGKSVDRKGHVADFIGGDTDFLFWKHSTSHVQKRTFQFLDWLDNAAGDDDPQDHAQDDHHPGHAACVHGELGPQLVHLGGVVAQGFVLGTGQHHQPLLHG